MATVEATVYRGTKGGKVIEGKERFTAGDEELLIKVQPILKIHLTVLGHTFWIVWYRHTLL